MLELPTSFACVCYVWLCAHLASEDSQIKVNTNTHSRALHLQVCGALLSGFVRRPSHSRGMWLSGVSNNLLAFTYAKAVINTLLQVARPVC